MSMQIDQMISIIQITEQYGVRTGIDMLSFFYIIHTYMYMIFHTQKLKFKENSISRKSTK